MFINSLLYIKYKKNEKNLKNFQKIETKWPSKSSILVEGEKRTSQTIGGWWPIIQNPFGNKNLKIFISFFLCNFKKHIEIINVYKLKLKIKKE